LLVIFVAGYLVYSTYISSDKEDSSYKDIRTVKITKGDLKITVAATGRVKPDLEVVVKSKASGGIIEFSFEEGDVVKRGGVVVRLDPQIERSRLNQAKANLLMAEAKSEKAKISRKDARIRLERQRRLFADRIVSQQDLDNAQIVFEKSGSDIKIAEAEVMRLREALIEAEDRLNDTEITAPITGTILEKFVEEGQIITSGTSSTTEGTSLFNMADLNKIYISANVDETDVGKVQPGQDVSITADAYPGWSFNGKVIRIAPKGRVESTIIVFDVIVEVRDKEKSRLKPLMTANVEILTDLRKGVLLVSSEAVRVKSDIFGLYTMKNGEQTWVPLKIGETDGILTEIEGDVSEGTDAIVSEIKNRGVHGSREKSLKAWGLRRILRSLGGKKSH
ncbi:MAG: efflux RND transporter periplasmic adaptor subunit, partial [Thermodesulfobacteriota bacterium]